MLKINYGSLMLTVVYYTRYTGPIVKAYCRPIVVANIDLLPRLLHCVSPRVAVGRRMSTSTEVVAKTTNILIAGLQWQEGAWQRLNIEHRDTDI